MPCGPSSTTPRRSRIRRPAREDVRARCTHPRLGDSRVIGTPLKLSDTPLDPTRRAPMLGEHTDDVLAAAGFSDDEIGQLRAAGVAR